MVDCVCGFCAQWAIEMEAAMTYQAAIASIPADSEWSCSFGYPGEDNYSEFWRDTGNNRYQISRKDSYETAGWSVARR